MPLLRHYEKKGGLRMYRALMRRRYSLMRGGQGHAGAIIFFDLSP